MKTIGLIGGITWISTLEYYRNINQLVNDRLGGVASAKLILFSVNFDDIKRWTEAGDWESIGTKVIDAARKLELAGADCLLIGANTMHKIADQVQAAINIPLIHIAVETAKTIRQQNLHRVLLLGTKYTMELDFYKNLLAEAGIEVLIPEEHERGSINTAIYEEMGKGIFLPERKRELLDIIERYSNRGAEGVILGCTEIPVLLKDETISIPTFDTLGIHVTAAVDFALP